LRFEVWQCRPRRDTLEERKGFGVAPMQAAYMKTTEERWVAGHINNIDLSSYSLAFAGNIPYSYPMHSMP